MFILLPRYGTGDPEANKLILLLIVFGFFIASGVVSCNEVRYTISGRTQDAAVEKMTQFAPRNNPDAFSAHIRVDYTLTEPGGLVRHESDDVSKEWLEKNAATLFGDTDKAISVQYLAGSEDHSRLVGHSRRWVMIPFGIAIIFLAVVTIRFWREFNAHQRRMEAQRS